LNKPGEKTLNGSWGSVLANIVLVANIKNEESHFHHPLFRAFWRVFVPRLLASGALLRLCEKKVLFVRVRLCSSGFAVEHSLIFNRRGRNEQVNLCLHHYVDVQQLHLLVLEGDPVFPTIKQEIELSFEEAKLLRTG
jgi:hypothetical protein